MNPNTYHEEPSLKKAVEGYTKVGIARFMNRELVETSYYKNAGAVLKELTEAGLELDGKTPANEAQWKVLAHQLGIPDPVPVSAWAVESIEQGRKILRETVWTPKTARNIDAIFEAAELSGPGQFRAPLLEGPPGTSKTHAARVAAAILGRPVMYIRSEDGAQSSISARLLRGGPITVKNDRWKLMEEVSWYGVNAQPLSRLKYLQTVGNLMKEKGKTFQEAHRLIEKEKWEEIADAEALPREGVLTYENVGLAEIGRRNGAVVIFDEANRWSQVNINEMESFLEDKGRTHPVNTLYILCCNEVDDGGVAKQFNGSLLDRCVHVKVESMDERETLAFLESMAGVAEQGESKEEIKTELGVFNIRAEVEQRLKEQGLSEGRIEELLKPTTNKTSKGMLMSEPGGRGLLKRLAQFHVMMAEQTADGAELDPKKYKNGSTKQVTIRSLFDAYKKLGVEMRRGLNLSLDESNYLELISPAKVAEAVEIMLERVYVSPFSFDIEGEIIEDVPGSGPTNTRQKIEEIIMSCGLDQSSVLEIMEDGVDWEKIRGEERKLRDGVMGEEQTPRNKAFAAKEPPSGVACICGEIEGDLEKVNPAKVKNLEVKLRLAGYDLNRADTVHYNPEHGKLTQYIHKKMKMKDDLLQPEEVRKDIDEEKVAAGLRNSEAVFFCKTGESEIRLIAKSEKGRVERHALSPENWTTVANGIRDMGMLVLEKATIGIANIKTVQVIEKYIKVEGDDFNISSRPLAKPEKLDKGKKEMDNPEPKNLDLRLK